MEEIAQIKARVSLRSLLERDGIALRRAGAAWVACCPFHEEKTGSFVVHEEEGGDWYRCFGCEAKGDIFAYWMARRSCDFAEAKKALAVLAGVSAGSVPAPMPKREIAPVEAPVTALGDADARKWERACADLYTEVPEMERISFWRGYRLDVTEWAARRGLMGWLINRGQWREAFAIQRPAPDGMSLENIGWHVRLAPHTRGNETAKASWRYEPRKGLGAWPFVVLPEGGIPAVRYLFCCEGQWDALALIDMMNWDKAWPKKVAVMGMRGATSWKRVLDYDLSADVAAFLIADCDEAGKGWFTKMREGQTPFAEVIGVHVKRVFAFWPGHTKDLNDLMKALDEAGRLALRMQLLGKILRAGNKKPKGPTFFVWLKRQAKREDVVGDLSAFCKPRKAPRGRARRKRWERFLRKEDAPEGICTAFDAAWNEWEALKAA